MQIKFCKLSDLAKIPTKATRDSAGFDLYACISSPITIAPGMRVLVNTGLAMEIPTGYCGMVCSRSGLAANYGVFVLNAPGIIDSDYRGEVKVILGNFGNESVVIKSEQRIAQLIITPYADVDFEQTASVSDTLRGTGGFGSTGN